MRIPAAQIEKQVLDATKSVIASRRVQSHVNVSGRTVGSHPMVGEPCHELSIHEKVLDAIERVTAGMSCYSVAYEITPARAEFLVELSGFELLTSTMKALTPSTAPPLPNWLCPFPINFL